MSLGMTVVMLVAAWGTVAGAMLWGVMRISRRHHPHYRSTEVAKPLPMGEPEQRHAIAH